MQSSSRILKHITQIMFMAERIGKYPPAKYMYYMYLYKNWSNNKTDRKMLLDNSFGETIYICVLCLYYRIVQFGCFACFLDFFLSFFLLLSFVFVHFFTYCFSTTRNNTIPDIFFCYFSAVFYLVSLGF